MMNRIKKAWLNTPTWICILGFFLSVGIYAWMFFNGFQQHNIPLLILSPIVLGTLLYLTIKPIAHQESEKVVRVGDMVRCIKEVYFAPGDRDTVGETFFVTEKNVTYYNRHIGKEYEKIKIE